MGMGEPLQNYDAVLRSIRILNHSSGRNIGIRHITISTCGVAPAIRQLAREEIRPRLAISLSAPSDALRDRLMPINRKYPIAELLDAVRAYQAETGQRVTFEYVMIEKVNDTLNHAKLLVKLLRGLMYNVNLIEHNPFTGLRVHRQQPGANPAVRGHVERGRRRDDDPLPHGPGHQGRLRPAPGRLRPPQTNGMTGAWKSREKPCIFRVAPTNSFVGVLRMGQAV